MAYVKTNWQTGDVITAAKLNNMETGIYDATEAAAAAFAPDIDDPQDGDVIKYDSTAEKWVNGAASGGGGVTIVHIDEVSGALDKTAQELFTAARSGVVMLDAGIEGIFAFSMLLAASDKEGDTPGTTEYTFLFAGATESGFGLEFVADSLNGYPAMPEP